MAVQLFPERNCASCTAEKKREWGCMGDAVHPYFYEGSQEYTCIRRPVKDDPVFFNEIFTLYNMYQNGYLPNSGGYLAQTPGFLQVINIMQTCIEECTIIKEEKERQKQKARAQRDTLMGRK